MAQKTNVDISQIETLLKDLEKELKSCKGVQIGWLKDEVAHNHKNQPTDTKQSEVVLTLNFGSPEKRIPPRPFLTIATSNKQDIYNRRMKALFDKEMSLGATLVQFGKTVTKDIQDEIDSNMPPPNSPITIEKKGGSTHTLMDTSHMRNSIHVQIMKDNNE